MIHAFLQGLNIKRLTLAIVAVFIFTLFSNFVIHELLLKSSYEATMNLWRPKDEMSRYLVYMLFGQFLIAKFFTIIFAKGYEGRGIGEGVRFGLLMGFFSAGGCFIQYVTTPMPASLLWSWILAGIVQSIGAGIVASLVYKR